MNGPPSPKRSIRRGHCPSVEFFKKDGWYTYSLLDILFRILTANPPDAASVMRHAMECHCMEFKPEETSLLSKYLTEYMESYNWVRPELVHFLYKKGVLSCVDGLSDILYRKSCHSVLAAVISEKLNLEAFPTYLQDRERQLRRPSYDCATIMRVESYEMVKFVKEMSSIPISLCVPGVPGYLSWHLCPEFERTMTFLLCLKRSLCGAENLQGVPREMWLEIIKHITVYDILIRRSPLK